MFSLLGHIKVFITNMFVLKSSERERNDEKTYTKKYEEIHYNYIILSKYFPNHSYFKAVDIIKRKTRNKTKRNTKPII